MLRDNLERFTEKLLALVSARSKAVSTDSSRELISK